MLAKELLGRDDTANRRFPNAESEHFIRDLRQNRTGREGVIFNTGMQWQEQRHFMLSTLKDFGFGRSSIEQIIAEEVREFMKYLELKAENGPVVFKVRIGNRKVLVR